GVSLAQAAGEGDLLGIAVMNGDQPRAAVVLEAIDGGPVGDRRDGGPGELGPGGLVVERAAEQRAGLGEKAGAALGGLGLGARGELDVVERSARGRLLALRGEGGEELAIAIVERMRAGKEKADRPVVGDGDRRQRAGL